VNQAWNERPPQDGNAYVTITSVREIEIHEFLDSSGRSVFARWFDGLTAVAAARVTVALTRLGQGNFSNVEGVGAGVYELKVDFGPGYRVYFGKDGERLVILLGGSAKKRQGAAIGAAQTAWAEYRRRKGGKEHGEWH
jgi:putative addiction module killer protein